MRAGGDSTQHWAIDVELDHVCNDSFMPAYTALNRYSEPRFSEWPVLPAICDYIAAGEASSGSSVRLALRPCGLFPGGEQRSSQELMTASARHARGGGRS